ncbi:OmpP1/FadL family transporter [Flavihumibacter solisilvae]|uniref:Aromatic hydrocarbon degradation membrane protein n=1 Tax=Flavihumibacter solisilvae TaxID=1349421 RepID=A0A0C1L1D3_9BACT|nr:hypothetical protein [Flavihumibacter solisilvae]KIC93441.1 hypothetical protein OI18_16860 [Flavihumibacter solisilvae]
MRKSILFLFGSLATLGAWSQVPEDALRMSWSTPSGTARNQAIGGVMTSLGGDITANFINPAGIAMYKTSEIVLSPGYNFFNNKSTYRGSAETNAKSSSFILGTSGLVFGISDRYKANKSSAFSIAVNRSADFNNKIAYSGTNNFSSFSEAYAVEVASSGLSIDDALNSSSISFPSRMALYTYLVDTLTTEGFGTEVVGTPMRYALQHDTAFLLNQSNTIETSGGITEVAISFAGNSNDKFYFGGSLGVPILNYERNSVYTETDATNQSNNYFNSATLRERYTSKGVGVNLKLGAIFKPVNFIRVGAAIHTPTLYGLKDSYDATMETDLDNYNEPTSVTIRELNDGYIPEYKYDLTSPWRFLVGGSYVFHGVEDIKQQRGFISADLEYVTYSSNRFKNGEENTIDNQEYYDAVNGVIKQIYKGALNAKIGGELKFNTTMARAGFAYYGNPYEDKDLDGKRMYISGGVGYRDKGFFIDLAYVHRLTDDVNFPYRLPDKANTYAETKGSGGNVIVTAGIKF